MAGLFSFLLGYPHIVLMEFLWGKKKYIEVSDPVFIPHSCVHCSCFCIGNTSRGIIMFFGTPVNDGNIGEMNC